MVLELNLATQSCEYREYSRGLRTQPWGDCVFRVRGLEVCLPTLTTRGLAVRKFRIQTPDYPLFILRQQENGGMV